MSIVVQGVVTELVAVLARIGELDPEQSMPFYEALQTAIPSDADGKLIESSAVIGYGRLWSMFVPDEEFTNGRQ